MSTNYESGFSIVIIGTSWASFFLDVHTPGPLLGRDIPPGKFCVLSCCLFSFKIFFIAIKAVFPF